MLPSCSKHDHQPTIHISLTGTRSSSQTGDCTELYRIVLHCLVLHRTVLYSSVSLRTVLHYIELYCTVMYRNILTTRSNPFLRTLFLPSSPHPPPLHHTSPFPTPPPPHHITVCLCVCLSVPLGERDRDSEEGITIRLKAEGFRLAGDKGKR
jgi:hypothetical protein